MTPCTQDIIDLSKRYVSALLTSDIAHVQVNSVAHSGIFLGIAFDSTAPLPLVETVNNLANGSITQVLESNPSGFSHGDVAWLTDFPRAALAGDRLVALRVSLVLQLTEEGWKVAQIHFSRESSLAA